MLLYLKCSENVSMKTGTFGVHHGFTRAFGNTVVAAGPKWFYF